jgi:sorbitol-specific phosphotransferase system component IIBC
MLKPVDPGPPSSDRSIGELVSDLIDHARDYARAEIDLLKAIAADKISGAAEPAMQFGLAFILALAGVAALAVGIVAALAKFIGPLAAGFTGLLIFAALAGLAGWYGVERLKRLL